MALTEKKRRFAAALRSGASNKEAAIAAGYSAKTAAQAGSRLAKDPDVQAELARKKHVDQAKAEAKALGREVNLPDLGKLYSDPKDFLMALMNDAEEDPKLRLDAAKALMPVFHAKKDSAGKKAAAQEEAEKVASRFAPAPPPRLVASGGKKL